MTGSGYKRLKRRQCAGSIAGVYRAERAVCLPCPLFAARVPAGFPSPADDYVDERLDLNELLIRHPAATFFVRVAGDSMTGAGIHAGDVLIVDRTVTPRSQSIIVAALEGELMVKRLVREKGRVLLVSENAAYPPLDVTGRSDFEVWGVAVHVIHRL